MTFRILTVCTGNICRSPLAEQLLRRDLASLPVEVSSAGIGALVGDHMPEPAIYLARELGVTDAGDHVSRQLVPDFVKEADLVLAMARDHRRAVVEMVPSAMRRVFTLREFAHILPEIDDAELSAALAAASSSDDALRRAVDLASSLRGVAPPPPQAEDWDVVDPYRRSDEIYAISGAQLAPAAAAVSRYLKLSADRFGE